MAMAYKEIPKMERPEYVQNAKQDNYPSKNYMNFTQIPKNVKEKLNLPMKNSTYLKKMITKKSQQSNQQGNKPNQKHNYQSNVFPLYNTNPDNFKRSYSINDSKKPIGNEAFSDNVNSNTNNFENNYGENNKKDNLKLENNNYTLNNTNKSVSKINNNSDKNIFNVSSSRKQGNTTKSLLGTSYNIKNNININDNHSKFNNNSRSKSNGKSNKHVNNPMMNLIRTFTGKSSAKENPATYRKYRAQTKSTDKLYQNTTKYPVHINSNDSAVGDYANQTNEVFNYANAAKAEPYAVNDVNVNLSKYNDYEYYHNLSLHPHENFNSNKVLSKNKNFNNNNNNNNTYNNNNYSNNKNGFSNENVKNNPNSKMKKSFDVLSDILDSHFTVSSPNHPKINLAASAAENFDIRNGDSKINLSAYNSNNNNINKNNSCNNNNNENNFSSPNFNYNNINNLNNKSENNNNNPNQNLNMSLNKENISGRDFYKDKIYQQQNDDQNTKLTINLSYLGENPPERYLEALEHIMTILDPIFDRLSLTQKLEKFIENSDDHRRTIRLGSLVGLYVMLKKFQIEDEYKITVLEKIVSILHNYETQEELFLVACLEIAGKIFV